VTKVTSTMTVATIASVSMGFMNAHGKLAIPKLSTFLKTTRRECVERSKSQLPASTILQSQKLQAF
jgi:hypothetical protein